MLSTLLFSYVPFNLLESEFYSFSSFQSLAFFYLKYGNASGGLWGGGASDTLFQLIARNESVVFGLGEHYRTVVASHGFILSCFFPSRFFLRFTH